MRIAVICTDKPDHLEVRKANREAHLAYLAETGVVEMAGPFIGPGGMDGSLLVLEVADLQAAQTWAAQDPYAKAGLFERVEIREWKKVIG